MKKMATHIYRPGISEIHRPDLIGEYFNVAKTSLTPGENFVSAQ